MACPGNMYRCRTGKKDKKIPIHMSKLQASFLCRMEAIVVKQRCSHNIQQPHSVIKILFGVS